MLGAISRLGNSWSVGYVRQHGFARGLWTLFWMRFVGMNPLGRLASRLVAWAHPPKARVFLPNLNPRGYVAPGATVIHDGLKMGRNVFVGDGVIIYRGRNGGPVELADGAAIWLDTFVETAEGGSVTLGPRAVVMPRCQLMAVKAPIRVGAGAQIAQGCAFYPYKHGTAPGIPIFEQELESSGGIDVGDGAWIGTGVTVLSGVRIGAGAVVGAGSLVIRDVPDNAIAMGAPARIVGFRGGE